MNIVTRLFIIRRAYDLCLASRVAARDYQRCCSMPMGHICSKARRPSMSLLRDRGDPKMCGRSTCEREHGCALLMRHLEWALLSAFLSLPRKAYEIWNLPHAGWHDQSSDRKRRVRGGTGLSR